MTISTATEMPVLELIEVSKLYAGVPAVNQVSYSLMPGKIHALLGENGAGKSTLAKAMAGVVTITSGHMRLEGQEYSPSSPHDALNRGVAMVFQETSLVPGMTVAQNLYLGREAYFNRLRGIYISAQQFMQGLNFDVDPTATVSALGAAKKQMVEIARAVLCDAKVIIFDEPTATLTPEEKEHFFKLMYQLKERGVAIVFITHAIEEAMAVCDSITVLRDSKHVITGDSREFDRERIVKSMVGRDLSQTFHGQRKDTARRTGRCVLSVQNLRAGPMVKNNSLSVFAGQVTGIFGLVGSGRTETFKVVCGLMKRNLMHGGRVVLNGQTVRYRVPASSVQDGIAYITEDRKIEGYFETMSISRNIYLGLLAKLRWKRNLASASEEADVGEQWIKRFSIRAVNKDAKVVELSGGNQQKVVIAQSLIQEPDLIIFDEPTRGVDVGAISDIHRIINQLADEGKAVVVISSYLPEVLALSDRVLVSRAGKIVEEFSPAEATEEKIMFAAVH